MMELKPCPFCGREAEVERCGDYRRSSIITCSDCGCRLETNEEGIEQLGIGWNTRTADAKLAKVQEHLRIALEALNIYADSDMKFDYGTKARVAIEQIKGK